MKTKQAKKKDQPTNSDRKVVSLTALYRKLNAGGQLTKRELELLEAAHPAAAMNALDEQKRRAGNNSRARRPKR